jgi:hypothetical protein
MKSTEHSASFAFSEHPGVSFRSQPNLHVLSAEAGTGITTTAEHIPCNVPDTMLPAGLASLVLTIGQISTVGYLA